MNQRLMDSSRRAALAAVAIVTIMAVAGCAQASAPSSTATESASATTAADAVVLDDATQATLESVLDEAFAASGMPGVAVYVQIGDDVWTAARGVGDVTTQEAFDPGAFVRIASNTKTIVATAVLQLVDDGQLSLDDTVEKYIPDITNGDRITVRDLLAMSSGLWEFTTDAELINAWVADPAFEWTSDQTVELIKNKPAQFEPGEKVVYTDSNYVLLGKIIEEVTGMDAAEAINTMVVEPLGLTDTDFPSADERGLPDPHQQGYRPPGEELGDLAALQPVGDLNPEVGWTAGNMTSTLDDLVVWVKALVDGEMLSPELQAERLESKKFDGQKINFGYGLGIVRLNDFLGHDGAIMGYSSVAMRNPEADATFVIVGNASTNSTTPTLSIFIAMLQELYPDQLS